MKKLALFTALFALIATLFFVACKKDEAQPTHTLDYANPNNPYDFVGLKHNEGLDILKQNKTGQGLDMAQDFQILAAHGFGDGDYKPHVEDFAIMLSSRDPIKAVLGKYQKAELVSENLSAATLQLDEILNKHGFSRELASAVKTFEATIPSLNLTEHETQVLYYATSIARYSNAYWMANDKFSSTERAPWRLIWIIACDVAGGWYEAANGGTVEEVIETAASTSGTAAEIWDLTHMAVGPNVGWGWGGGIFGPPCAQGYACPCTIEMNPLDIGPYYMAGTALALSADNIVFSFDGSLLGAQLYAELSGGSFNQAADYTIPQPVVDMAYANSNFPAPVEPTVLTQGPKEVIVGIDTYTIVYPITDSNGATRHVFVTINQVP